MKMRLHILCIVIISSFIAGMAYRKSLELPCAVCFAKKNMLVKSAQATSKRNRLYTKKIAYTPELYLEADALFHPKQNMSTRQNLQLIAMHMFAGTTLLTAKNFYAKI